MLKRPPQEFMEIVIRYVDKSQVDELEQLYTPEQIIDYALGACEFMVEDWFSAFSMTKELAIGFSSKQHPAVYSPIVANSSLEEQAQHWLFAEPRSRRGAVVYVMGKLSDKQYLPVLEEAFEFWKDRDPFMMEGLIFELGWLGDENVQDKVRYLATHKDFVFRLTMIERIQYGVSEGDASDMELFEQLQRDPHAAVVAATKEDPHYFNLQAVECSHELFGDESDNELTLEDFRRWIEG